MLSCKDFMHVGNEGKHAYTHVCSCRRRRKIPTREKRNPLRKIKHGLHTYFRQERGMQLLCMCTLFERHANQNFHIEITNQICHSIPPATTTSVTFNL